MPDLETYCLKCKSKRPMENLEATFTSAGSPATRGVCPVCGSKLYRMGRTPAHDGLEPSEVKPRTKSSKVRRKGKMVIVESPAKARTVSRYLGKGYTVKASIGHVRDLLRSQISVAVENNFEPKYRVPNEKREIVKELKKAVAQAEEVYLATDPDREGEAIAWHLLEAAEIDADQARRVVFHEITKEAIEEAFRNPRSIDTNLVDAQQARRILDRLVGYNISPILWTKVRSRLSAGRVQSVALRLVVDREREIENFDPKEYWSIDGDFLNSEKPPMFRAGLRKVDGEDLEVASQLTADGLLSDLRGAEYKVGKVKLDSRTRKPPSPFITSSMQQSASRRLRYSARKTMAIAQQLYEGIDLNSHEPSGLITYMRTDSTQVSKSAQAEARQVIRSKFGEEHLPEEPPTYKTRARRAQEAHEAIRPTSIARTPESIKGLLSKDQHKLYQLVWRRFLASQMKPAEYDTLSIEAVGRSEAHEYLFKVNASSLRFPGFLAVLADRKSEEPEASASLERLPALSKDDPLELKELFPEQHFTQPPARYSDASLIRALEENGIGRPSTYAPILSTLQRRGYVERDKRRMIPTEIGMTVNDLLVDHFPNIVDLGFTARMEQELDEVAEGDRNWVDVVREFYEPFEVQLERARELMPEVKAEPELIDRKCPECDNQLLIRYGRYGKFIGCSNFPECRHTEPWLEKIGVLCPLDGGELAERRTRKGRTFYGCSNYPECEFTSWKRPEPTPCPNCGGLLVHQNRRHLQCLKCENVYEHDEIHLKEADLA
ncbi:MAG: type I DNA topoisomerase [Chloroflexi bacterium]|nr:type I DNA topoisomerase [Chloroflexota bacterium]MDK1044269.1 type I DNA topoisomerase [Anaerolineales bacterium]MCI0772621.1 type I DNA topoisomerase [Chloroflexota bacterium]MCI0805644.1 type I DNA topoisomerase [Chloroflexota bacterium]MCI0826723.1 type I DNA topoisomerase [Chloroflexota bacterium]